MEGLAIAFYRAMDPFSDDRFEINSADRVFHPAAGRWHGIRRPELLFSWNDIIETLEIVVTRRGGNKP